MNVRFTILLVLLVAVIGGLVAVTQVLRSDKSVETQTRLYRVGVTQFNQVTVTRGDTAVTFAETLQNGEKKWTIKSDEGEFPVDEDRWSGIPFLLLGPQLKKILYDGSEGDPPILSEYGLDEPNNRLILKTPEGDELVEAYIGDLNPTGDGYYASIKDSKNLYVVDSSWGEIVIRLVTQPPYALGEGPGFEQSEQP